MYVVKGSRNKATKKKRAASHSNSDKESDFVEDLLRDYKKKSENKGKRVKASPGKRASSSSDKDVTHARNLDKNRHPSRHPDKELGGKRVSSDEESQEQGIPENWENRQDNTPRSMKGLHGNPGAILNKIGVMKSQIQPLGCDIQDLRRVVTHVSKNARGERTLGQHIDRLLDVVGSAEDIKNLMQKVPDLEAKNRAYDSDISEVQGKVSLLEAKFCNIEKLIK